jgi:ankyrin repeat protein
VLHHAVEKGHISVLESLLANGVDMYSAVEIADNAGRTPLFEAVDNIVNDEEKAIQMIDFLTRSRN